MSTSLVRSGARRPGPAATGARSDFPQRIHFGAAGAQLAAELRHLGTSRALVLCAERDRATVVRLARQAEHEVVVVGAEGSDAVGRAARSHRSDVVVALGGGTLIDQAKRACAILGLPLVALPTTYSGAELGDRTLAANGSALETAVAPVAVIYDPCLTLTLSPRRTGLSLLGAIGAGVEVLRSAEPSSAPGALATHGLRELGRAALDTVYCPDSLPARSVVQFGAYLVGAAAAAARTSAVASADRELAGVTGLDDAEARALVALWLVDSLADARPDVHAALLACWPGTDPSTYLHDLAAASGVVPEPGRTTRHIAAVARKYGI